MGSRAHVLKHGDQTSIGLWPSRHLTNPALRIRGGLETPEVSNQRCIAKTGLAGESGERLVLRKCEQDYH